jgi:OFA family oxalate/formate antiporter-like MFS transporter
MLVPIASVLSANGGWSTVFISAAVISITAAVSAKFILAPMRKRWIENSGATAGVVIAEARLQPSPGGSPK